MGIDSIERWIRAQRKMLRVFVCVTVSRRSSPCKSWRMSRKRSRRRASYSTSLSSSLTLAGTSWRSCASIDAIFSMFRPAIFADQLSKSKSFTTFWVFFCNQQNKRSDFYLFLLTKLTNRKWKMQKSVDHWRESRRWNRKFDRLETKFNLKQEKEICNRLKTTLLRENQRIVRGRSQIDVDQREGLWCGIRLRDEPNEKAEWSIYIDQVRYTV